MQIALFQPEIPQNVGTILRTCACLNVHAHIIHPCGFPFDSKKMKRALMDYWSLVQISHHTHWDAFLNHTHSTRHIFLSTHTSTPYHTFQFQKDDILIAGQESVGIPPHILEKATHHITIPMHHQARSLNVSCALSIVLGEAIRQMHLQNGEIR